MQFPISSIRVVLYAVLIVFSFIVLALAAARINHTSHLVHSDSEFKHMESTSQSTGFYEPIVAELLVTALLSIGWSIFVALAIFKRFEVARVGTFLGELLGLGLLSLLWLVGASIASSAWGDVSLCISSECQLLAALLAFAWLSWLVVLALFVACLMFAIANKAWNEPLHGRWDPRISHYQG